MENKKNIYLLYALIFLELIILIKSKVVIECVIESSKLFIFKIFPSVFPTMVLGNLLVRNNVWLIIPRFIKNTFNKLFGFNDIMTSIFIISMFTGTPSNAMYINSNLNSKNITEKQAETLLCSTHFINPLFVIGGVGIGVFKSIKIGFLLFSLLCVSNLIKAFICKTNRENIKINNNKNTQIPLKNNLSDAIKSSIDAALLIFGIVIMFSILVSLLKNIFNFNAFTSTLINGVLEMTGGVVGISNLPLNMLIKFILSYIFLNFGGLCIQMQTMSMIESKKIRYLKYLIFRIF